MSAPDSAVNDQVKRRYWMKMLVIILTGILLACAGCNSSDDDPEELSVNPEPPTLRSFAFNTTINPGLPANLDYKFDEGTSTRTFSTMQWIENIDQLKATFQANGKVTVNGVEQQSGVTGNDFRHEVVYTVTVEDKTSKDYRIVFKTPQSTGLPVFKVDTKDGVSITSKEDYVKTNIAVYDPDTPEYNVEKTSYSEEIRGRGNSTWEYPKKPYRIKFDKKTSLFGYEAAKSWVLLANYRDPSLIMNTVAFELGRRFNLPFTNHTTHVELFLNGTYQGSYVLTEQVQVGAGRVDIDEDEGFLAELDFYYDEDPKFKTNHYQVPVMIKSPEDLEDPSGYDFVKDAINELESALFAEDFSESGYHNLIDLNTFIDYILIQDIVMNWELQVPASIYMYRDKGASAKICMGPLWDFDCGFGYKDDGITFFHYVEDRIPFSPRRLGWYGGDKFFQQFFKDPYFCTQYKDRWNEKYAAVASIPDFIDEMAAKLQKSYVLNQEKWGKNHNAAVTQMKTWWTQHVAFLNTDIDKY
jgi:hypothetical protein